MDILYVVGRGSDWNNNELRYSLRSIAKYGKHIGRVFLVGYKPDFVNDKVIHIPCEDPFPVKHNNILYKVLYAAQHSDIASHFLISSDDHYYVAPTDFDNLPVYYRREEIPLKPSKREWHEYALSLHDTRGLLEEFGLSIYQTNPHCNTHFDMDVYRRHKNLFDIGFRFPEGAELNCIMGNLLIREGWKSAPFVDAKLNNTLSLAEIEERAKESGCISSKENVDTSLLVEYLHKKFPNKCKYEL